MGRKTNAELMADLSAEKAKHEKLEKDHKTLQSLYEGLKKTHNELIAKEAQTAKENEHLKNKKERVADSPFSDANIAAMVARIKPRGFCIDMEELDRLTQPKPSIHKFIMVEKMKGQEFSMKVNRNEIQTDGPARIAGERVTIGEIVAEMTSATAAMLENHIAGAAMKIEVTVTDI